MRHAATATLLAFVLTATACGAPDDVREPNVAVFTVTSEDFTDGGELPRSSTASAFGGQCDGANVSPQLAWSAVPDNTARLAITMIDKDAGDFVHWMIADVPGSITSIDSGAADDLDGVGGKSSMPSTGNGAYFGPCPPSPDHHYVFTVYALDAPLGLEPGFTLGDFTSAAKGHVLAVGSLTGVKSGPAQ